MTSSGYLVIATISMCLLVSALAKSTNPEEMDNASLLQSSLEQDPEVTFRMQNTEIVT
jgi:hypothetical protein